MSQIWVLSTGTGAKLSWGQASHCSQCCGQCTKPSLQENNSGNSMPTAASQAGNQNLGKPARLWLPVAEQAHGPSRGCLLFEGIHTAKQGWVLAPDPQQLSMAPRGRNAKYGKRKALRDPGNGSVSVFIKIDTQETALIPSSSHVTHWFRETRDCILQPPIPSSLQEQFVSSSLPH